MSASDPAEVVKTYLSTMVDHDFDAMAACLADDVVRVGPFGDTYTSKGPYVEFLSNLMPSLEGYSMQIDRIVGGGKFAVCELSETVEMDGKPIVTPESLVFDFDDDGLISHISIYIQRLN